MLPAFIVLIQIKNHNFLSPQKNLMQMLLKIISYATQFFKLCLSDTNINPSSTRIGMLIINLWSLADWLLEFHSKGIYTLTWENFTILTSAFGLKSILIFPETNHLEIHFSNLKRSLHDPFY